jgi:hypothetical protein
MRLNPYHPESVWFHLGRALYHAGRSQEAAAALEKVTQPRTRELAYGAATGVGLDDPEATGRAVAALRAVAPSFDADRFARSIPYAQEGDRTTLLDALRAAGL